MATELRSALDSHPDLELSSLLLRSSWRWTHLRMVPFGVRMLREIPRLVEREGIELVLFSSMVTAAFVVPLRRKLEAQGVRIAAIPVGRDVTLPWAPYQKFLPRVFETIDLLLPISHATAEECVRRGAPPGRIRIVPCGVDPERFATGPGAHRTQTPSLPARDPLPEGALLLCSVGRHVERKGFDWFVDGVMPLLPPHVHFWIAGEGPITASIQEATERHGLEDRVRLLGCISDASLKVLYRSADLFVMPNVPVPGDMEGFGVVMLEAGICGLPVIASRLEGIADVIREGENGHLVSSGDPQAFAAAILRYDRDRRALREASLRARGYVRDTFSWPVIADRYHDAFCGLTGRNGSDRAPAAASATLPELAPRS